MFKRTQPGQAVASKLSRSGIETLESRRLLSGSFAVLHHGVLEVHGSNRADHITVSVDARDHSRLDVSVRGKVAKFKGSAVRLVRVDGGKGNDMIKMDDTHGRVAARADLVGGAGNDTLVAGASDDTLEGGAGDDSLVGGSGQDSMNGDDGDDTLVGGVGPDTMNGGAGDDSLEGGNGQDDMNGDDGNDTLKAGTGHDQMKGGNGADTFDTSDSSEIEDEGSDDRVGSGTGRHDSSGGRHGQSSRSALDDVLAPSPGRQHDLLA